MQFEIGISTSRYLPPSGTAGFERSRVKGKSLVPCPPPMMIESTLLKFTAIILLIAILLTPLRAKVLLRYNRVCFQSARPEGEKEQDHCGCSNGGKLAG